MTSPSKKKSTEKAVSQDKAVGSAAHAALLTPCPIPKDTPLTILIDTREPIDRAYAFPEGVSTERVKLDEGDYSIKGFEGLVAVERKTLDDFAQSIMLDRYWEEIRRTVDKGYRSFVVVVEGSSSDIFNARYTSQVKPASLFGALNALAVYYRVPVVLCDNRQLAAHYTFSFLKFCWDRRYKGVFWQAPL